MPIYHESNQTSSKTHRYKSYWLWPCIFLAITGFTRAQGMPSWTYPTKSEDVPFHTFRLEPEYLEDIFVFIIFVAVLFIGTMIILPYFKYLTARATGPLKIPFPPLTWMMRWIMIVILLPILEEILFRYYIMDFIALTCLKASLTQAFIYTTLIFAVAHVILAFVLRGSSSLMMPSIPGIQICDGLLLGSFIGLVYILMRFRLDPTIGLLITLTFGCFLFHILFNFVIVLFNVVANLMGKYGIWLHILVRLGFLTGGIILIVECYRKTVEVVIWEIWFSPTPGFLP